MKTSRIEEVILSAVEARWTKVAMVIGRVSDAMGAELPTGDERYELISDGIEVLIRAGSLEVQDNPKNWRFSEVRRSDSKTRRTFDHLCGVSEESHGYSDPLFTLLIWYFGNVDRPRNSIETGRDLVMSLGFHLLVMPC